MCEIWNDIREISLVTARLFNDGATATYVLLFAKIPPNHSPLHHDRMNAFVNKPLETPRPRYYADLYFLTSTVTNSVMIPFRCSPWAAVIDANPSGARAIPICWYLIHKGQNSQCHFMFRGGSCVINLGKLYQDCLVFPDAISSSPRVSHICVSQSGQHWFR